MCSHIENLPPEIRTLVLSMVDLKSLECLVRASPVYHQQYLQFRRTLLFQGLENTLGLTALEACGVYQSSNKSFSEARTKARVIRFLNCFRDCKLSLVQYRVLKRDFSIEDVISMVNFYCSVIQPLVQRYAEWALGNLEKESEAMPHVMEINSPLSKAEEARITRSLYRFQICCNMFGVGPHKVDLGSYLTGDRLGFETMEILMLLENAFEPWELEEISCIDTFATAKCKEIFDTIRGDVDGSNPKFCGSSNKTFDLSGNNTDRVFYMKGIITRGLSFLQTIFFEIKSHSDLVSTMQKALTPMYSKFIGGSYYGAFDCAAQDERRKKAPSERDAMEQRREPLPFQGEQVAGLESLGPPLAWTLLWKDTYSNMIGGFIGSAPSSWGYVMWDSGRLRNTGAEGVLTRQWKARWWYSIDDPRDIMQMDGQMSEAAARAIQ